MSIRQLYKIVEKFYTENSINNVPQQSILVEGELTNFYKNYKIKQFFNFIIVLVIIGILLGGIFCYFYFIKGWFKKDSEVQFKTILEKIKIFFKNIKNKIFKK